MTILSDIDYLLEGDPKEVIHWRRKTDVWGDQVLGSRATIAQLEWTDQKCRRVFGSSGFEVFQSAYNSDVEKSAGSHDFDRAIDGFIAGVVDWWVMQRFIRFECWWDGWHRFPPTFSHHLHIISTHEYDTRVGELIPGQRRDYRADPPRNGLSGHAIDNTPHPDPIPSFNYKEWRDRQMVELSDGAITKIAERAANKLLSSDLTLSDGTTVDVQQALRRAAQMPDNLETVRSSIAALVEATGKSTNTKVVNARTQLMSKLDEIDDQVG